MLGLVLAALARAAPGPQDAPPEDGAPAVRTLEERVSGLRQRVQATRERVRAETGVQGTRTVVVHHNEVGQRYWLESASYALDGEPFYVKTDLDGDLAGRTSIEVFDALVAPGAHELSVELVYRGEGWGRRPGGDGARIFVRSSHAFQAAGPRATITVVAHERSGADRPALRFDISQPEAAGAPAEQ
jgi:hypothetical protein